MRIRTPAPRHPHAGRNGHDQPVRLYGWHSVKAALANPHRHIRRLYVTTNAARRLAAEGIALPRYTELVRPDAIASHLPPDSVHQGLLAEADPLPAPNIEDLPKDGIVLVLDQVTDPHNVGAILRSAAAFAVRAVVTTIRHSPTGSGVLAKSASGALEFIPLVAVTNLARGLDQLKAAGFFVVGLDSEATTDLSTLALPLPLALIVGAEGKGLRRLTRVTCDLLARLALPGPIKSLNVSNATTLALYEASSRVNPDAPQQ